MQTLELLKNTTGIDVQAMIESFTVGVGSPAGDRAGDRVGVRSEEPPAAPALG